MTSVVAYDGDDFEDEANRAEHAADYAERHTGGQRRFKDFIESVRTLVGMLGAYRRGEFPMDWREIGLLIAALLYVINPVDAMPEAFIGPAGMVDDAAVVVGVVGLLTNAIARYGRTKAE